MNKPSLETAPMPLPDPRSHVTEYTFDVPNLLLGARIEDEMIIHAVREGGSRQMDLTTEVAWSEEAVKDEPVFRVRGFNTIRFAGQTISVLNDAMEIDGKTLIPSAPTTKEYMALKGTRVLIHFDCSRDQTNSFKLGRPVYKTVRNSIILP